MSRTAWMLSIGALAALTLAAPASAATPFTAGTGKDPSVAVGPDGSGHAVWATDGANRQVGYCRMTAGTSACNRSALLNFGAATEAQTTGRPIVAVPAPGKVVVVAGCWKCVDNTNRTYRWISTDNGQSFGAPAEISQKRETQGTGAWLDDVAGGTFVGADRSRVKANVLDSGLGVEYATGGGFVYGSEVVRVPGTNRLVAAVNDLAVVKYGVFTGASLSVAGINTATNWLPDRTLTGPEPDNDDTALNAGPNGAYLTYRSFVPNDSAVGLRRFDPATNTFGPALHVEGPDPIDDVSLDDPDSFQDAGGRIHLIWTSNYGGGRLRYRVSDPAAGSFTPAANLARQEMFVDPDLAAGADGKGFAAWVTSGGTGAIRIVPLDPQPEPPPPPAPPPAGPAPIAPTGTSGASRLPVSFTGRGNTLSAKVVGRRVRIRARGTITPPAGASVRSACTGKVKLKVKKRRSTLAARKAKLRVKRGRCRFGKTIFVKRRKVGRKTTRLRLKISFKGNAVLSAGSATKTLVVKK